MIIQTIIEIIIRKRKQDRIQQQEEKKEGEQKKTEKYEGINTEQSNIEDILERKRKWRKKSKKTTK